MKYLFITIIALAVCAAVAVGYYRTPAGFAVPGAASMPEATPALAEPPKPSVVDDSRTITYGIIRTAPGHIRLVPNLVDSVDSATAKKKYGCDAVTSAGFYTKENTPLGLFQTRGTVIAPAIQSALVDGYVYETANGTFHIGPSAPDVSASFAVQSGPVVIHNGTPRLLNIRSDEYARRIVAAVSAEQAVYFIVLYDNESVYAGPMLARVPAVIRAINEKELLNIVDAVNLDGGSASSFLSSSATLSELVPAGGFFCIK